MVSSSSLLNQSNKTAQPLHGIVQQVPKGALLITVLRTVEGELRRRKMIGHGSEERTPLWLLAETERNIFLWRHGKSLDDRHEYDFWVDLPALLAKRRRQLETPQGLNPFINPLWGAAPLDEQTVQKERDYLEDVEDLLECIVPHAEALSRASVTVRLEVEKAHLHRESVLLPTTPFVRRTLPS